MEKYSRWGTAYDVYPEFTRYSDHQLIDLILNGEDRAAAHLLYNRYRFLLEKICKNVYNNLDFFQDLLNDLYLHLKGKTGNWHALHTFNWEGSLAGWLERVARHEFVHKKMKYADPSHKLTYVDDRDESNPVVRTAVSEDADQQILRHVLLVEAISQLKNPELKLVMCRRAEGYSSAEIAHELSEMRRARGDANAEVKPSRVDNLCSQARKEIKRIMATK